jgi:hypothetical protein
MRLVAGQWFSLVSFTNKTDCHNITEILLKVALNTTTICHNITEILLKVALNTTTITLIK